MKVAKLRGVLSEIAKMQHNQGDPGMANALYSLVKILESRDKDEVAALVSSIQQRREFRSDL